MERSYLFKVRVFVRRIGKTCVVQNITIRENTLRFATGKRQFEDDRLIAKCVGPIPSFRIFEISVVVDSTTTMLKQNSITEFKKSWNYAGVTVWVYLNRVCIKLATGQSALPSESRRPRDQCLRASVTPRVNLSLSFVSRISIES